jgi:hypothetical protein
MRINGNNGTALLIPNKFAMTFAPLHHFFTPSLNGIDRHASPAHPIAPMTNSAGQNRTNAMGLAMKSNARRRFDNGARVPVVAV